MNIVGSGLIASAFNNVNFGKDFTLFASGVSNSQETKPAAFKRESKLLKYWLSRSESLIYFSTCSVDDETLSSSLYVRHKMKMEALVALKSLGIVIRLPQVVGNCNNKNTLTNFLATKICTQEPYNLYQGTLRNLIDIDDVVALTNFLLKSKELRKVYSFALPIYFEVSEIVAVLEKLLNQVSMHTYKDGCPIRYPMDAFVRRAINDHIISCNSDYLETILGKYYQNYTHKIPKSSTSNPQLVSKVL